MTLSSRALLVVLACAPPALLSFAPQGDSRDDRVFLELSESESIREVTVDGETVRMEIAKYARPDEEQNPYELFDESYSLRSGSITKITEPDPSRAPVAAVTGRDESGIAEAASAKGAVDWRDWISDTMDGPAHVSFSANGERFVTVVHQGNGVGAANVTVWHTKPKLKAGPMRRVEGLIHAAISSDGSQVFLHTSKGLFVHDADEFGSVAAKQSLETMGQPHTLFRYVESAGGEVADFFFLVKKLVVELYPATLKQVDGKWPKLEPIASMNTDDYAVSTHYEPVSELMLVVEHDRARLMQVSEKKAEFLAQHVIPKGVEFRSCKSLGWDSTKDYHTAAWAVGARRNVTKPTRDRDGRAEFGTYVLAYRRDSEGERLEVLAEPEWVSSERWNLYSPRIQYSEEASRLIVYTRDKAWTAEIPR